MVFIKISNKSSSIGKKQTVIFMVEILRIIYYTINVKEVLQMSDCPYDMNLEKFYLDQKNTVHTLKIDRGEIAEILAKYPMEYSQFDCDMIIEYEDQLREQGFDMERIDDIELVKDWNQEMSLIFLQRAED